jgi:hypothetical protein
MPAFVVVRPQQPGVVVLKSERPAMRGVLETAMRSPRVGTSPRDNSCNLGVLRGLPGVVPETGVEPRQADTTAVASRNASPRVVALGRPVLKAIQKEVVPEIGIEPTTYALRMRRSTN